MPYESDSDVSEDDEDIYYDPEETSMTKYNIVLCELYNDKIHGNTEDKILNSSYLVINRVKKIDESIFEHAEFLNRIYRRLRDKSHTIFKNYKEIIFNNYIKPELAECIYLPTGEYIAILKTFWIRLIQRTWKKIFKERKLCLERRLNLTSIKYREFHGKWPDICLRYPSIQGMLLS